VTCVFTLVLRLNACTNVSDAKVLVTFVVANLLLVFYTYDKSRNSRKLLTSNASVYIVAGHSACHQKTLQLDVHI